jgi:hypothetical protein
MEQLRGCLTKHKATADTVDLGPPHAPKEESINVFNEIERELKKHLIHTRHEHNSEAAEILASTSAG